MREVDSVRRRQLLVAEERRLVPPRPQPNTGKTATRRRVSRQMLTGVSPEISSVAARSPKRAINWSGGRNTNPILGQAGLAQIAVDEQHALADFRQSAAQVAHHGGLALLRREGFRCQVASSTDCAARSRGSARGRPPAARPGRRSPARTAKDLSGANKEAFLGCSYSSSESRKLTRRVLGLNTAILYSPEWITGPVGPASACPAGLPTGP